jgi:hypothetical protein
VREEMAWLNEQDLSINESSIEWNQTQNWRNFVAVNKQFYLKWVLAEQPPRNYNMQEETRMSKNFSDSFLFEKFEQAETN